MWDMIHHVAKIREDAVEIDKWGRIVIPVKLRRALSIEPGEHVVLRLKNGTITLSKSAKETRELARELAETARKIGQQIGAEESEEDWKWFSEQYARRKLGLQ